MKKLGLPRGGSLFLWLAGLLYFLLTAFLILEIREDSLPHGGLFCGLFAFLLIWFLFFLLLTGKLTRQNAPLWKIYIALALGLSLPFSAFFLPCSIPDEVSHYVNAIRYSNILLFREPLTVSAEEAVFMAEMHGSCFVLTPESFETAASYLCLFRKSAETVPLNIIVEGTSVPLGYLFSSVGLALGHLLRLAPLPAFYMGRLFNFLAFTACTALSIHWLPFGKKALMAVALFPMTIHLASSYSYDPVVIASAFLLVSYVLKLSAEKARIRKKQLALCLLFCLLLAPCKVCVYYPLLALPLLIPKANFEKPSQKWVFLLLCLTLGAALIFGLQLASISSRFSEYSDTEFYSVSYILSHPGRAVRLFISDLRLNLDLYIQSAVDQKLGSFYLSGYQFTTAAFTVLFAAGALPERGEPEYTVSASMRLLLILTAVCSYGMIVLTFMTATPLTSAAVVGVAGRYLTPLFALMIPVLKTKDLILSDRLHRALPLMVGGLSFLDLLIYAISVF